MSELLAITWEEKRIVLRQITNVGIWSKDLPELSSVSLKRPLRASTLKENYILTRLCDSLKKLLSAIPASDLPLWFLFPNDWVRQFHVDNPNLQTEAKIQSFLIWEAGQRLHGETSEYQILLPFDLSEPYLEVRAVKKDIADAIIGSAQKIRLKIGGSAGEPAPNEAYSFTQTDNFRNSFKPSAESKAVRKKLSLSKSSIKDSKWSLWIAGSVLVLVICVILFIMVTSQTNGNKSGREEQIAEIIDLDTLPPINIDTLPTFTFEAKGTSPVKQFMEAMPTGVQIRLLTISQVNLIAEMIGVSDIESLLAAVKSKSVLSDVKVVGSYKAKNREVIVVRSTKSVWKGTKSQFSRTDWETKATAAGLKVRKRSARGSYDAALAFVDKLWNDPQGVQKIYLADYGRQWNITVQ